MRRLEISEDFCFILENLRKKRNQTHLSCVNINTKWGESIARCLSAGLEFAGVGLPAQEQILFMRRVNVQNVTVKTVYQLTLMI